jgi:hypothetical protein
LAGPVVGVSAVVVAAVAGWVLAGPPDDAAAVVPPACPTSVATGVTPVDPGFGPGVADRLVPMPLPQPRGPVSARICRFVPSSDAHAGFVLHRSVVVEPVRTAVLAGVMNTLPSVAVVSGSSSGSSSAAGTAAGCRVPGEIDALLFRYSAGAPVRVDVSADQGWARSSMRAEGGRADVVRAVDDLICPER